MQKLDAGNGNAFHARRLRLNAGTGIRKFKTPRPRGFFETRQTRIRLDDHYLTLAPELEINQGLIGTAQHLVRFLAGRVKGENPAKAR